VYRHLASFQVVMQQVLGMAPPGSPSCPFCRPHVWVRPEFVQEMALDVPRGPRSTTKMSLISFSNLPGSFEVLSL